MAVFIDDANIPYGRMRMSHMWADTLGELLDMVDRIGVQRRWIQKPPKASWVHFDVSMEMKARAIAAGAILTDRFGPAEHVARLDVASGDPARVERGRRKLKQVENSRSLRCKPGQGSLPL